MGISQPMTLLILDMMNFTKCQLKINQLFGVNLHITLNGTKTTTLFWILLTNTLQSGSPVERLTLFIIALTDTLKQEMVRLIVFTKKAFTRDLRRHGLTVKFMNSVVD